jgi:hypothetical protein
MTRGRRIPARDRGWLAFHSLRVVGPLHGVTVTRLRQSLVRLHAERPDHPAVCRLDAATGRWVPVSRPDSRNVVVSVIGGADPADAVTRWLIDEPLGERPLLLAVCEGFVGAKLSHGFADGRIVNTLFPELIRAAVQGRTPRLPFPRPTRLPVVRALVNHFGRHPDRLRDAARVTRPPETGDVELVPWRPDVMYRSVRSATAPDAIRAWRDRYAPGVSAAAILFAATAVALHRCGLPPRWPGAVTLVDARRYLPAGGTVDGNFCWGQYLSPADLTDPRAVHDTLTAELDSGRPLAMLALRTARLALRLRAAAPAAVPGYVPADPRPQLTLTHIGRLDGYADLPWAGPPDGHHNISVPTTSGPEAMTVSLSELGGALYVNVSCHRSTFDPEAVSRAIELVATDPVGLVAAGIVRR